MQVIHRRCAGLDVHKETVVACVRVLKKGKVEEQIRTFSTMTSSLYELGEWLASARVGQVAMEATGVYWRPVWHILEAAGLPLMLVNAAHCKAVPGRKSDVTDAAWLASLIAHGLVRGSFVPPTPVQELRDLTRARKQMTRQRTQHVQRIHKILEDANIKITSAISDVMGQSGRAFLDALIQGISDPEELALSGKRPTEGLSVHPHRVIAGTRDGPSPLHAALLPRPDRPGRSGPEEPRRSGGCSAVPLLRRPRTREHRAGDRPDDCIRHPRGDRIRYESIPQLQAPRVVGRPLSEERRKCRQAPLHPRSQRCGLAQAHARAGCLVGRAHQGQLRTHPLSAH